MTPRKQVLTETWSFAVIVRVTFDIVFLYSNTGRLLTRNSINFKFVLRQLNFQIFIKSLRKNNEDIRRQSRAIFLIMISGRSHVIFCCHPINPINPSWLEILRCRSMRRKRLDHRSSAHWEWWYGDSLELMTEHEFTLGLEKTEVVKEELLQF